MMRLNKDMIEGERLKIEFVDINEGYKGEYDPDDPDDVKLLRFDVSIRKKKGGAWQVSDSCSYCTQIPVDTPATTRRSLLLLFYKELFFAMEHGRQLRRVCEILSWATPKWIDGTRANVHEDINW
jgi:hypothetical protein